jgi:hypothetical protein
MEEHLRASLLLDHIAVHSPSFNVQTADWTELTASSFRFQKRTLEN